MLPRARKSVVVSVSLAPTQVRRVMAQARLDTVTPSSSTSTRSRGTYPSKQFKFGPAPLASFEDLPTDEQNSSSDEERIRNTTTNSNIIFVVSDHDTSHHETGGVTPTPNERHRKSSWTDMFSFRKSATATKLNNERKHSLFNFNFFHKDDPGSHNDVELEELSVRQESPLAKDVLCGVSLESCATPSSTGGSPLDCVSPVSNLETVIEVHQADDRDGTVSGSECSLSCASSCSCSVEQECEECVPHAIVITCHCAQDCNEADNEDDEDTNAEDNARNDLELQALLKADELDHHNQVHITTGHEQHLKLKPTPLNLSKSSLRSNCSDRLKITPVERPRSITPINVNSFEAYITQFEHNHLCPPSGSDKLTITLPGGANRHRYARKSNPFIWQEFCEKGLTSPCIPRKRANSCFPQINQERASQAQQAHPPELCELSPEANLTPITPLEGEAEGMVFHYDSHNTTRAMNNSYNTSCSCECYTSEASHSSQTTDIEQMGHTPTESLSYDCDNEDQPLVSPPCECVCHLTTTILSDCPLQEVEEQEEDNSAGSEKHLVEGTTSSASSTLSSSSSLCSSVPSSQSVSTRLVEYCSTASNESK